MKVSIVTISFNQARYLRQCIESVLTQDYDDLEYILVDPGSTDGSRAIIESYGERIVRDFAPDDGPADGLNKGFRQATGEIYGYVNADDALLPGALRKVASFLDSRKSTVDVVLGHGNCIDAQGHLIERLYSTRWSPTLYAYGAASALQQATFFRAEAFHRVGGFNVNNRTCWDGELLVDMTLAGANVEVIHEFLGEFRIHPESVTGSGRLNLQYVADQRRIARKALGRELTRADQLWSYALRVQKNLRSPRRTLYKVLGRVRQMLRPS